MGPSQTVTTHTPPIHGRSHLVRPAGPSSGCRSQLPTQARLRPDRVLLGTIYLRPTHQPALRVRRHQLLAAGGADAWSSFTAWGLLPYCLGRHPYCQALPYCQGPRPYCLGRLVLQHGDAGDTY